ncbi:hypothetical protein ACP70R_023238 [Stipagrostis hirtigluma subsp. patula]
MENNDRFSDLLWMPHSQHKVSKISENPSNFMNIRHHRVSVPYHPLCRPGLENVGFFQIARMKKINVDKYLISALVERWRPETSSSHLPVGEMTITLQDVSCLWVYQSKANQSLENQMGNGLNPLRGSIVFTDTSGDGVPAMYLQFMENMEQPTEYNWGAAVLAMLYRQLNMGAEKARLEISGPLLLLQLWCWSHLPLGRPINIVEKTNDGDDQEEEEEGVDLDCPTAFGAKWCTTHQFLARHNSEMENGMYTVFLDSQCLGGLDNPIPYPRDNIEWTGDMPSGPPLACIGLRSIKTAAWGIKCVANGGYKKLGKYVLRTCVGNLRDLNLEPRLHNMLHEAGLPSEVEDIPSDDMSAIAHPPSPPRDCSLELIDDWISSGRALKRYMNGAARNGDGIPTMHHGSQLTQETANEMASMDQSVYNG